MSFNVGSLVASIRLDGLGDFNKGVDQAGEKFTSTGKKVSSVGASMSSVMKGVAVTTGAITVAAGAYVKSLFKTGTAYNQLQQQSRAALTTILGGAKQANAQMDKLDDFATNSPFAKQVFITAQQQLLGFGLQAKKVIPTLQAVQDAVAAVGGSNDQIEQITYALAQMKGQGKLTGETLTRLGQYGIDAATIIGKKMGKSGAEIRAMASKPGGIPADKVWDPLVNGLEEKFKGAAANVKKTMAGATDRIRAASRDIGSLLAKPFVDPHQGGLYIDWANGVADVMRAAQAKLDPLISMLTGRAAPAFKKITDLLGDAKGYIDKIDPGKLVSGLDAVGKYAPAISGVAGGFAAMNLNILKGIPILGDLLPKINPVVAALAGVALSSPDVRDALGELLKAFQPLIPLAGDVAKALADDLNTVLPPTADLIKVLADAVTPLIKVVADIPGPVIAAGLAFIGVKKAVTGLGGLLTGAGSAVSGMAGKFGPAESVVGGLGKKMQGVGKYMSGPWGLAIGAAVLAVGGLAAGFTHAQREAEKLRDTLDEGTGALTKQTRAEIVDELQKSKTLDAARQLGVSVKTLTDAAMGNEAAQKKVNDVVAEQNKKLEEQSGGLTGVDEKTRSNAVAADLLSKAVNGSNKEIADAIQKNRDHMQAMGADEAASKAVKSATDDFTSALKTNKVNTDKSSAAYKLNKDALDTLGGKAKDYITTIENEYGSTKKTTKAQQDMAGTLVDAAKKMGMSRDEAVKYTAKLLGIPEKRVTKFLIDKKKAEEDAAELKKTLDAVAKNRTATVTAKMAWIYTPPPTSWTQGVGMGVLKQADGGIVQYFANGGTREDHRAQIAPAGAWRVWAEPETGGEAYIPLAASKRTESTRLWEQVGRMFGKFADGGVVPAARDRVPTLAPSHMVAPTPGQQDPGLTLQYFNYATPGLTDQQELWKAARALKTVAKRR